VHTTPKFAGAALQEAARAANRAGHQQGDPRRQQDHSEPVRPLVCHRHQGRLERSVPPRVEFMSGMDGWRGTRSVGEPGRLRLTAYLRTCERLREPLPNTRTHTPFCWQNHFCRFQFAIYMTAVVKAFGGCCDSPPCAPPLCLFVCLKWSILGSVSRFVSDPHRRPAVPTR